MVTADLFIVRLFSCRDPSTKLSVVNVPVLPSDKLEELPPANEEVPEIDPFSVRVVASIAREPDVKVRVYYSMPAMPGMPPMNYKTDAKLQGSTYKATMNLSMAGPWNIEVKIKRDAKISAMKFNIDVR